MQIKFNELKKFPGNGVINSIANKIIQWIALSSMTIFWKETIEWLQACIKAIKEKNWNGVLYGTKVFLQKVGKNFKRFAEHFSKVKDSDKWLKTTTISEEEVEAHEVPEDILIKAEKEPSDLVDITSELEYQLKL